MTLQDLIRRARIRLDDRVSPYQWSDAELTAFANAAVNEACKVSFCLSRTEDFTVRAGSLESDPVDNTILHIRSASVGGTPKESIYILSRTQLDKLESAYYRPAKNILYAAFDGSSSTISVLPPPEIDTQVQVSYVSTPNEDEIMIGGGDEPLAIPMAYRLLLVDWMVFEALSDPDVDKANPAKATDAERRFYTGFGRPISAHAMRATASVGVNKQLYGRRFGDHR